MAQESLSKKTSKVSLMTFTSRTLGFVRDLMAAQVYGINAAVDAFNIAFKVPNLLRNLFSEGAFSQSLVPIIVHQRYANSKNDFQLFIERFLGNLLLILFSLTAIGMIFAPLWIHLLSPGLDLNRHLLASQMLLIMMPYLFFVGLTAFGSGLLNSFGKFTLAAFLPALLNIVLISAAIFASHWFLIPVFAQAYGVCIAGFIQFFCLLPALITSKNIYIPKISYKDVKVKQALKSLMPAIFGSSVGQLNLFVNTLFASFLPIGSVSFLYYSERLAYFPQGVFSVALATVVMPHLVKQFSLQAPEKFQQALSWGMRTNLLAGIPATFVLMIFAGPIVLTLFQHGHFTVHDAMMTKDSIMTYAFGLQAFMLVKLFSTACYAKQDFKTPIRVGVLILFLNIALNALFLHRLGFPGLALATSLAAWVNAGLLFWVLKKNADGFPSIGKKVNIPHKQRGFYPRLLAVNFILVVLLCYAHGALSQWLSWSGSQRFLHLGFWLLLAIVVYFMLLRLFGIHWKLLFEFEDVDS